MRNLKIVGCILMLLLTNLVFGQRIQRSAYQIEKVSNKTARVSKKIPVVRPVLKKIGKKTIPFIPKYKLRNGKSYIYVKSTKLEVIKSRGRVISAKKVSRGRVGSNLLNASTTNIKICGGEDDCIDVMSTCDSWVSICFDDIRGYPICICF